ncbi:sugar phosphate isomerase/epimerase family protein [Flavobacterium daejeonense]|uniref:sugar phosphate isomerase/epimerase family protein n=1 Tax=Flavobacterium daejeonense TaxID=350893 RepID=UPI00047D7021|nr:sugar phosphate isomerase/epimerase family protein [Flavobacterium daejeonense]
MNRRSFLENTGKFGLTLGLAPIMNPLDIFFDLPDETQIKKDLFFKISLAQWSLHKAILSKVLDPLDFANKARELGFDAVEYVSMLYAIDRSNTTSSISKLVKELKNRSADNGVSNVLIMVDNEGGLASTNKALREDAIDNHSRWVDAAAGLGCHSIRVNLSGRAENFEIWKENSVDGLGRLAEYADKSKINVIVENHGGLSSDGDKLTQVMKAINLKNCGTLPDFGNFCLKREYNKCVEEYDKYRGVAELMPFAKGVSAKTFDFDATGNETTIDYVKMLQIVKDAGYRGRIGIEYEGDSLSEEDGIKATKALLINAAAKLK